MFLPSDPRHMEKSVAEGLPSDYNNDDDGKAFCGKLDGLAFIPSSDLPDGLTLIHEQAPDHLQCLAPTM